MVSHQAACFIKSLAHCSEWLCWSPVCLHIFCLSCFSHIAFSSVLRFCFNFFPVFCSLSSLGSKRQAAAVAHCPSVTEQSCHQPADSSACRCDLVVCCERGSVPVGGEEGRGPPHPYGRERLGLRLSGEKMGFLILAGSYNRRRLKG